jgi:hypothetical protein
VTKLERVMAMAAKDVIYLVIVSEPLFVYRKARER